MKNIVLFLLLLFAAWTAFAGTAGKTPARTPVQAAAAPCCSCGTMAVHGITMLSDTTLTGEGINIDSYIVSSGKLTVNATGTVVLLPIFEIKKGATVDIQ